MSSNAHEARSKSTTPALGRQRGQGLVELALIMPFLLTLTLGIVDVGILVADRYNVLYASREGARVGAANACFFNDDTVLRAVASTLNKPANDINDIYVYPAPPDGSLPSSTYQQYHIVTATINGFSFTTVTNNWPYNHRHNNPNYYASTGAAEWLGVLVKYFHHPITFIGQAFWGNSLAGSERTIMRIEPPELADGSQSCVYP